MCVLKTTSGNGVWHFNIRQATSQELFKERLFGTEFVSQIVSSRYWLMCSYVYNCNGTDLLCMLLTSDMP